MEKEKTNKKIITYLLISVCSVFYILSVFFYARDKTFSNQWLPFILWMAAISWLTVFFGLEKIKNLFKGLKGKKDLCLLIIILIGAFLVRSCGLSEVPILVHDEARDAGLLPEAFLKGETKDFFGYGIYGIPNIFFILSSIPHLIFPRTVLAVRFFSLIFGFFSVLLTFFLARKLFNEKIALISVFLLSFYHVHIHFSRSEFLNLFDSFWSPILVLCLFCAIEDELVSSIFFGLIAGLLPHFYQATRAILLIGVIYFGIYLLVKQRKLFFKKTLLFLVGFLIGFGPSILIALNPTRINEVFDLGNAGKPIIFDKTVGDLKDILPEKIIMSFGSTVYYPIDFHYQYGGPFLKLPFNIFFVVGLFLILRNIFKSRYNFLLLWVISVFFFNSIILVNVNFTHRLLSLVPALIIILGLGIYAVGNSLGKLSSVFYSLLLFFWLFSNVKLYFWDSVWKKTISLNNKLATTAGYYVRSFPRDIDFYFLSSDRMGWKSVPSWEYLDEEYSVKDLSEGEFLDKILKLKTDEKKVVFIIPPERIDDFSLLKQHFPACYQRKFNLEKELLFYSYECL